MSCAHLAGILNVDADQESRSIHDNMEWKLHPYIFERICEKWGIPELDLFTSRLKPPGGHIYLLETRPGHFGSECFGDEMVKMVLLCIPTI